MKVFTKGSFHKLTGLSFCCQAMSDAFIGRDIYPTQWTDHPPHFFFHGELHVNYCPFCGQKIRVINECE